MKSTLLLAALSVSLCAAVAGEKIQAIPFKQDPPITVDGVLDPREWAEVPCELKFECDDQVCVLTQARKSAADLSGVVKLAWRPEGLYVGADVTDDKFLQKSSGDKAYCGDHLELFLDATPGFDKARDKFGDGQYQIVLNPGNLSGDSPPVKAEAVMFFPTVKILGSVKLVSAKTDKGWVLEAMVPWGEFGLKTMERGAVARVDVVISDTDALEGRQEKIMFAGKAPWTWGSRGHLLLAVFTDGSGNIPDNLSLAGDVELFKEIRLKGEERQAFKFNHDAKNKGVAVLQFNGRLDTSTKWYSGYAATVCVSVNGKPVTPDMLVNKPATIALVDGQSAHLMEGHDNTLLMPYLPSYDKMPKFVDWKTCKVNNYPFRDDIDFCLFRLEIADLVKPGENTIVFESRNKSKYDIRPVLNDAMIVYAGKSAHRSLRPAPTGEIPTVTPRTDFKTDYAVAEPSAGELSVNVGDEEYKVKTRFSIPEGKWTTGSNPYFKHERKLEKKAEALIVKDTFTNLTAEDLPLMQHHEITVPGGHVKLTLNGLEVLSNLRSYVSHQNSSSYGSSGKTGLGVFPLNDEFRVHAENYVVDDNGIGVADRGMVLRPGAVYTATLAVIPTADASYWTFLNALRRELDVNFKIHGGLGYMGSSPTSFLSYALKGDWKKLNEIQDCLNAFFVWVGGPPGVGGKTSNLGAFGTDVCNADFGVWKNEFTQARKVRPDAKLLPYYHCFIDTSDVPPPAYADAAVLDKTGCPVIYGNEPLRLYAPTLDNEFGKMEEKIIERFYRELDIDGIYWDEFQYSGAAYSYNPKHWDGCSADIDQKTFKIERRKSAMPLLSNAFRLKMARSIKNHGKRNWLMVNSAVVTRELMAEKIISFTETEKISNCSRTQVYCPLQYGNGSGVDNEVKVYRSILAGLDYGVVHYWPPEWMIPTHRTISEFMFPITPLELHKGFIIGQERIVTKESGLYGWNDASSHETHVYDSTGWPRPEFSTPSKTVDGKTLTELRLPEDWSAVIVRKQ